MSLRTKVAITAILIGAILLALSSKRVILSLQDFFGVPGRTFEVGRGVFQKNSAWVLLDEREAASSRRLLFGVIPVVDSSPQSTPQARFFLFQDISARATTIAFIESAPDLNSMVRSYLQESSDQVWQLRICPVRPRIIRGTDFLECTTESNTIIYDPYKSVTVILTPASADALKYLGMRSNNDLAGLQDLPDDEKSHAGSAKTI